MSSTNRANAAARHVADYYVTPVASIKEFLDAFREDFHLLPSYQQADQINVFGERSITVLDPCAGGDDKHAMSYPEAIARYSQWNVNGIDTVDVREDSRATFKEDYLFKNLGQDRPYDVAITNPPFNIALDVIQKCLREVRLGGGSRDVVAPEFFRQSRAVNVVQEQHAIGNVCAFQADEVHQYRRHGFNRIYARRLARRLQTTAYAAAHLINFPRQLIRLMPARRLTNKASA